MEKNKIKNQHTDQIRLFNLEAQRRLKEQIPIYLNEKWTLHPFILETDGLNKKCIPLTTDGSPKSPRLKINKVSDLPKTANAVLALSSDYVVLDVDDPSFKLPDKFPLPFKKVKTGKGYHNYYLKGDITEPKKLIFGELQFKGLGVFIPGSFHPVSKTFYEIELTDMPKVPLKLSDIKPFFKKMGIKTSGKWQKGERNTTLYNKVLLDLSKNQGRHIPAIIETAKQSGLDKQEIDKTVESAGKTALNSGIDPGPSEPPLKKEKPVKQKITEAVKNLEKILKKLKYELRLNVRKDRIEIKGFGNDKWSEVTDEGYSKLLLEVQQQDHKIKKHYFEDIYKAFVHSNQVDPFKVYLESLKWDNKPRLNTFLSEVFNVNPDHKELAKWAGKAILLATVKRTFEPGAKHDEFVVLQGKQGIGKSLMLYHLLPDKSLFSNTVSFSDSYPRIIENILDKSIVEVAELSGFKKTDLEKMKNIITTQKDTVRLAYRRNARDYLRRCVFVGTTNDQTPLPDDLTGLRRFILIQVSAKLEAEKIKEFVKTNRGQLWGEAVALYKKGESARLPKDLWKVSAEVAEIFRGGDHSFEEVFLKTVSEVQGEFISIPQVLKIMKDGVETVMEGEKGAYTHREGGGWIKDISPKYQSKSAEILRKNGYKMVRFRENGVQKRGWIKVKKAENAK